MTYSDSTSYQKTSKLTSKEVTKEEAMEYLHEFSRIETKTLDIMLSSGTW